MSRKALIFGITIFLVTALSVGALFYATNEQESPDIVITEVTEEGQENEVQEISEVEEALRDRIVELESEVIWLKNKINILEENN